MTSGYFSRGSNSSEHFFHGGFVELAANGVEAHIALDMNWLASANQGSRPLQSLALRTSVQFSSRSSFLLRL